MTTHTVRYKRKAKGAKAGRMLRITVQLERADMELVAWWAGKRQTPAAALLAGSCTWEAPRSPTGSGRQATWLGFSSTGPSPPPQRDLVTRPVTCASRGGKASIPQGVVRLRGRCG